MLAAYMPHGACYAWTPEILWPTVVSDAITAIAYYSIPLSLLGFVHRHRGRIPWPVSGLMVGFVAFIVLCGTDHAVNVWNTWHGNYGAALLAKVPMAFVSLAVAVWTPAVLSMLERLVPRDEVVREIEAILAGAAREERSDTTRALEDLTERMRGSGAH